MARSPVAMITLQAVNRPADVVSAQPARFGRTAVTVTPLSTGAANDRA